MNARIFFAAVIGILITVAFYGAIYHYWGWPGVGISFGGAMFFSAVGGNAWWCWAAIKMPEIVRYLPRIFPGIYSAIAGLGALISLASINAVNPAWMAPTLLVIGIISLMMVIITSYTLVKRW